MAPPSCQDPALWEHKFLMFKILRLWHFGPAAWAKTLQARWTQRKKKETLAAAPTASHTLPPSGWLAFLYGTGSHLKHCMACVHISRHPSLIRKEFFGEFRLFCSLLLSSGPRICIASITTFWLHNIPGRSLDFRTIYIYFIRFWWLCILRICSDFFNYLHLVAIYFYSQL